MFDEALISRFEWLRHGPRDALATLDTPCMLTLPFAHAAHGSPSHLFARQRSIGDRRGTGNITSGVESNL
jgi:hypothetical protein